MLDVDLLVSSSVELNVEGDVHVGVGAALVQRLVPTVEIELHEVQPRIFERDAVL